MSTEVREPLKREKPKPAGDRATVVGQWMLGGLAAASFACALTVINTGLTNEASRTSLRLLALAIPALLFAAVITRDQPGRYNIGCLGKMIPLVGMFSSVAGIAGAFYAFDPLAGTIIGGVGLACLILISTSDRT